MRCWFVTCIAMGEERVPSSGSLSFFPRTLRPDTGELRKDLALI